MYKENGKTAIAKKRYIFKKGYMQLRLADKNDVKKELMQILGISRTNYFSAILNGGILNISLPRYEAINRAFAQRGITDVWDIKEV